MSSTTPALNDMKGNQATTVVDKEEMVRRAVFPELPVDPVSPSPPRPDTAHQDIDKVAVE